MTSPAYIAVEYKALTFAELGSQATTGKPQVPPYTLNGGIISADGNYFYFTDSDLDNLTIADISDRTAPTIIGTYATIDGLITNRAVHPMALDLTGQYLYLGDGTTTLYTLDLTDPEVPTTTTTTTITTAASKGNHVLLRVGSTLYVLGDASFQAIDISTPSAPSVSSTLSATTTVGSAAKRAYLTPDGDYIMFPEESSGSPSGQIGLIDITSTPAEGTPISLPQFDTGSGNVKTFVSGGVNFVTSITDDRAWFVGKYSDNGVVSYFWMTYEKGATWEDATLISDAEVGGEVVPTVYLATAPYTVNSYGTYDGAIVVARINSAAPGSGNPIVEFWEVSAREVFPTPLIKEGGIQSTSLDATNWPWEFYAYSNSVIVGISDRGEVSVIVPTEIEVTDGGWTNITADIRIADGLSVSYGISGAGLADRVANTGKMSFTLNNFSPNGEFSPGHASLSTGFQAGAPIRLQLSGTSPTPVYTKFLGRIESITAEASVVPGPAVRVTCVDSMDVLSRATVKGLPVKTNILASEIVESAIAQATGIPLTSNWTNSIDTTTASYPFAFDGTGAETNLVAEIQKAADSERGYFYPAYQNAGVGTDGGFRFESRDSRIASPVSADLPFNELTPEHSLTTLYNRVSVQILPRVNSAATTVLFTYQSQPKIKKFQSLTFTAPYADPAGIASMVSGINMVPPIRGTDYTFTSLASGGGTDYSDNLSVWVLFGASSAEVTVTNNSGAAFLSLFQLRGRGLYTYEPVVISKRDLTSIVQYGLSDTSFELPHEQEVAEADTVATAIIDAYSTPNTFVRSAKVPVAASSANLETFLSAEVGDKFFIENTLLAISKGTDAPFTLDSSSLDGTDELADESAVYVIHLVSFQISSGNIIEANYGLFPANVRL